VPIHVSDAPCEGGLLRTITLDRPDKRNALDPGHLSALAAALDLAKDDDIRAVLVRAEGSSFSAGYDVSSGGVPDDDEVVRVMHVVRRCRAPVVAAIHGPAYGVGCELALCADLRVGTASASFCIPAARLGLAYAAPGLARLTTIVGAARARRFILTAEVVQGTDALALGLVDQLADEASLRAEATALATRLAGLAPLAVQAMKVAFNALEPALATLELDQYAVLRERCFGSDDLREGVTALRDKRRARFTGH